MYIELLEKSNATGYGCCVKHHVILNENPTADEIDFWAEVFETHRKIMGTSSKPKSERQIIKWLQNPHSDAAEYKMWGNGVALPCVCFVLAGIVWAASRP